MKRILKTVASLSFCYLNITLANTQFTIEMQNYTEAELTFYCKTITGSPKSVFLQGAVVVPPKTSVTENVEIAQHPDHLMSHQEIQCGYSENTAATKTLALQPANGQSPPQKKVLNKTMDSIAIDTSFTGVLQWVVKPSLTTHTEMGALIDTHAEFMVSFQGP